MHIRALQRSEIPLIWTIDRREVHTQLYEVREGELVLVDNYFEVPGWHPQTIEDDTPKLYEAFDRGAHFVGAFDGDALVGVSVLDGDRLVYLYVGRSHRGVGLGSRLFSAAIAGATSPRIVISATPTRNTVDFYLGRGCVLDPAPDPQALAAEPDDIHLVLRHDFDA